MPTSTLPPTHQVARYAFRGFPSRDIAPPTEKQKQQRSRFAARHAAVTAWLNANKPSELNGPKGTEAYLHVQRLKRQLGLSLINQVLLKYMDGDNVIRLPETKEQQRCKPQKPKKPWKRISFGNPKAFHREKTSNCPKSNIRSDFEAARLRGCETVRLPGLNPASFPDRTIGLPSSSP